MEVPAPYNLYSICFIWIPSFANIFQVKIAKSHEQVAGIGIVCQTFGWGVHIAGFARLRFVSCFVMHSVQWMLSRLHGRVGSGRIFPGLLTGQSARQRKGKSAKLQDKWGARKSFIESDMHCLPSSCTADTTGTFCSKIAWSCADLRGCCWLLGVKGKRYELWHGQQPDWHRWNKLSSWGCFFRLWRLQRGGCRLQRLLISSSATVCTWQAEAEAGHHDHNAQDEGHNGSRILCSWY